MKTAHTGFGTKIMFKLYFPSGKTFLSHVFDDAYSVDSFGVIGSAITFTDDTSITIATFDSESRAYDVLDQIINAYHANLSFTLPKQKIPAVERAKNYYSVEPIDCSTNCLSRFSKTSFRAFIAERQLAAA